MKRFGMVLLLLLPLSAQTKLGERKSLLDSDPRVVYLTDMPDKQITLTISKEAPVYSDVDGKVKLGMIKADQKVKIEAITDKAYKVRGKGAIDGISGWVGPWAFTSNDPMFVENMKKFYTRQIEINALIAAKEVALGMTTEEVTQSLGKPTKSSLRETPEGKSGKWEFIESDEQRNYTTVRNPYTGDTYRQLTSVTQIEKSKKMVEFTNGIVSALEDQKSEQSENVRIVVPPVVFRW